MSLFTILAIGFILGIKHSIEPDHVIAVSTIAGKTKKLWQTSLTGIFWGVGHTVTLLVTGMLLIGFKISLSEKWILTLEMLVGIMLVYLGIRAFLSFRGIEHRHASSHKKTYLKSVVIGFIHGLAGSSAMVLLTMNTMNSMGSAVLYMVIFGLGTCIGMLLFTGLLGLPFNAMQQRVQLQRGLIQIAGGISTVYGIYYIYNLGMNEGLFSLWF